MSLKTSYIICFFVTFVFRGYLLGIIKNEGTLTGSLVMAACHILLFGPVTIEDMQIADPPSPSPLTFDQPFMDDGECVI